jgi:hypothetical protein
MVQIPDSFDIVAKGQSIDVRTRALTSEIRITGINLTADQAAALARLVNLSDGEQNLEIEIKVD